jgi:TerC family integral membrane protein
MITLFVVILSLCTSITLSLRVTGRTSALKPNVVATKLTNKFPGPIARLDHLCASKDANQVASAGPVGNRYEKDVKRTLVWVALAAAFSVGIALTLGTQEAIEFCSGYVLEYCLSVDNLFVFLVLFDYFNVVDIAGRERVLGYGIWGAVFLRGLFIGAGATALQQSSSFYLVFAAVLAVSSFKIIFGKEDGDEEESMENNAIVNLTQSLFSTTQSFDGSNFFTTENGMKVATPLLLCLVCVELSDVVFAFDSVPAVFGVTDNPFIVFTSNMFAIAGLRSLFGVLSQAVADLEYLEKAVGVVLAVISAKLGAEAFRVELLSPLQSLVVVLSILGAGIGASLTKDTKSA